MILIRQLIHNMEITFNWCLTQSNVKGKNRKSQEGLEYEYLSISSNRIIILGSII